MATLRLHGLHVYVYDYEVLGQDGQHLEDKEWKEKSKLAATLITMLVNPEIIPRVPVHERSSATLLMQRLETMSTHVRFFDLPAELRNRIYKFTLADGKGTIHVRMKTAEYPVITKISHQMRSEALPIFYSSSTFELQYDNTTPSVAATAHRWVTNVVRDHVIYLRSVSVKFSLRQGVLRRHLTQQEIRFTLNTVKGLSVRRPDKLATSSRLSLLHHVKTAESMAEWMGCKNDGRALLLALVPDSDIWKSEGLYLI